MPAELMTFPASLQPAVLKAFGKMLIARTNEVATALVEKFNLSSITLQGTVCMRGSMQARASSSGSCQKVDGVFPTFLCQG